MTRPAILTIVLSALFIQTCFALDAAVERKYPVIDAKFAAYDRHMAELRKTYSAAPAAPSNKAWVISEISYMALADHYTVNFATEVFPNATDPGSPEVAYFMKLYSPRMSKILKSNVETLKKLLVR